MNKKIIIHVGFHKTGSSSIQHFFRDVLKKNKTNKLAYPKFYNKFTGNYSYNHSTALFSIYSSKWREYHINKKLKLSAINLEKLNQDYKDQFRKFLNECAADTIVLSGEDLSILPKQELKNLLEDLRSNFNNGNFECKVIAYTRHPLRLFISEVQQSVKGGLSLDQAINVRLRNASILFLNKLESLKDVFGDGLEIFEFENAVTYSGGLVKHFIDNAGLNSYFEASQRFSYISNEGYSLEALELLSAINVNIPLFIDGNLSELRKGNDFLMFQSIKGVKFSVSSNVQDAFYSRSANSIEVLRNNYGLDYNLERVEVFDLMWNEKSCLDLKMLFPKLKKEFRQVILWYFQAKFIELKNENSNCAVTYLRVLKVVRPTMKVVAMFESEYKI